MRANARPIVAGLVAAAFTALAVLLVPAAPAAAHNSLTTATPAKDALLREPPTQITLQFLQKLNPAFTTIVLSDESRQRVETSDPAISGAKGTITVNQPLGNGTYTVAYRVVSADGHPVQGSYRFTVADPTTTTDSTATTGSTAAADSTAATDPTATIEPAATTGPAPTGPATAAGEVTAAGEAGDGPAALIVIGGVALALLTVGAVVAARRRPKRPA